MQLVIKLFKLMFWTVSLLHIHVELINRRKANFVSVISDISRIQVSLRLIQAQSDCELILSAGLRYWSLIIRPDSASLSSGLLTRSVDKTRIG